MSDIYTYSQKTQGLPVEIIELPNGQTGIRLTADILYQHTPIGPVHRAALCPMVLMPRALWRRPPFAYEYLYEAILHDYLYRYQEVDGPPPTACCTSCSRANQRQRRAIY